MRPDSLALLLLVPGSAAPAAAPPPGWIDDGARTCVFEARAEPVVCRQHRRIVRRRLRTGETWDQSTYRWTGPDGQEVRYRPRLGLVGVSDFTIGELVDPASALPAHRSDHAVSYAPDRETLVIGVPGDGYGFSVRGGV